MQADGREIPLPENSVDYLLILGVLQHCPYPEALVLSALRSLKQGGQFSADMYKKSAFHPLRYGKYLWRPLTKRIPQTLLLSFLRYYVPVILSFDATISRIPKVGKALASFSPFPVSNPDHYVHFPLNRELRREWALLDTFDALAPRFDRPLTDKEWRTFVDRLPLQDSHVGRRGIHTVIARK
jgi:SAM-dependent methyltransferase